ncbi:MAG: galactokinase family protein [Vicinamibacterales bacterium]|nr:galactokinase family protein [Vicinamibacterales bacterium]
MLPGFPGLVEAGMSADEAARKVEAFDRCNRLLGGGGEVLQVFVPGRIEVLGKHTDYAGGRSLLCAVERGFAIAARPRRDDAVTVTAAETGESFTCRMDPALEPRLGHWSNYPATVVRRIARNFPGAGTGADVVFSSDLPPAAGMSSSSALMIGVLAALAAVNRLTESPEYQSAIEVPLDLAGYAATIENGRTFRTLPGDRGVGTFGGSEDHTAILSCQAGRLARYAFAPVRCEGDVALPEPWVFVVASSGIVAEKTGAARELYNRASRLAGDVLQAWNRATGRADQTLEEAVSSAPGAREHLLEVLGAVTGGEWDRGTLVNRARQFCLESLDLVPAAMAALAAGDLAAFGDTVDRSQQAAEAWLGNQVPETVFLAASARACGAVAASAFGAGFGGSVWAMVRRTDAPAFAGAWGAAYRARFPDAAARAVFVPTRPGPAACRLTG